MMQRAAISALIRCKCMTPCSKGRGHVPPHTSSISLVILVEWLNSTQKTNIVWQTSPNWRRALEFFFKGTIKKNCLELSFKYQTHLCHTILFIVLSAVGQRIYLPLHSFKRRTLQCIFLISAQCDIWHYQLVNIILLGSCSHGNSSRIINLTVPMSYKKSSGEVFTIFKYQNNQRT